MRRVVALGVVLVLSACAQASIRHNNATHLEQLKKDDANCRDHAAERNKISGPTASVECSNNAWARYIISIDFRTYERAYPYIKQRFDIIKAFTDGELTAQQADYLFSEATKMMAAICDAGLNEKLVTAATHDQATAGALLAVGLAAAAASTSRQSQSPAPTAPKVTNCMRMGNGQVHCVTH